MKNVLAFGSTNFNTSLEELKDFFNFKLTTINNELDVKILGIYDVLLVHEDYFKINKLKKREILKKNNIPKVFISNNRNEFNEIFPEIISIPLKVSEINQSIENAVIKKDFSKNSKIKVKSYTLDKNEKKLSKLKVFISLTEKEVQLIELFLSSSKPISKKQILEEVWKYSSEADTHTVETHIYRLRKKIKLKFTDDSFIISKDNTYLL
mgnify:CR=1 FL=1